MTILIRDHESCTESNVQWYFFYGHEKADGTLDEDSGGILVKVNVKTGETKLLMSESTTGQGLLFQKCDPLQ